MTKSQSLRRKLAKLLVERGAITDPSVRRAFESVPREVFIPEVVADKGLAAIYEDAVFVTKTDSGGQAISSSSQPGIMAPMLNNLELEPGQRILEIGAGTGYNAALMKSIVGAGGRVTAIDIDADTAKRARAALKRSRYSVRVVHGDGMKGVASGAPYDRIIATASTAEIPRAWIRQLTDNGLLEIPLRLRTDTFGPQLVVTFRKTRGVLTSVRSVPGGFMTIRERDGADALRYPMVGIYQRLDGNNAGLAVSGAAIGRMSDAARRRLVGVLAAKPRRRTVFSGDGNRAAGLALFAALASPASRRVEAGSWWATGIVAKDGSSYASLVPRGAIVGRPGTGTVRLSATGTTGAENEMLDIVERWRASGRPMWSDLSIVVDRRGEMALRWPSP